ncbi:MAG: AI-2E family transporter [Myxococcales bacterium]|nr:AI-2E family transporter [Myxococcales bacterium]
MADEPVPSPQPDDVSQPNLRPVELPPNTAIATLLRFLRRWGFPLFILLVLILGRSVLLPFVFAVLVAYLLAPVVRWLAQTKSGKPRMARGLAIVLCYAAFLTAVGGFVTILAPRIADDVQRVGEEAPGMIEALDKEWLPKTAAWLESHFPFLKPKPVPPSVLDLDGSGLPPGTIFTTKQMADGRVAVQLLPGGLEVRPVGSGYRILPNEDPPAAASLEDRLRAWVASSMVGLKSQGRRLVATGQSIVGGVFRGIFTFFIVLMLAAFILIDMEKVHKFLRLLFPPSARGDYDAIIAGVDRGLSGVIRGQLIICLVNGILTYIGLVIFDVKYALVLGFVAGIMSLIPIFGSILSTIPIVISALVSGPEGIDIVRAAAAGGWIAGIHLLEANFLNPKIIGTAANIHPVLVVFSLVLGEHSFGLVGALLAVPVASTIQVLFLFFYRKAWKDPKAFA